MAAVPCPLYTLESYWHCNGPTNLAHKSPVVRLR
jgi:hypothetical protein